MNPTDRKKKMEAHVHLGKRMVRRTGIDRDGGTYRQTDMQRDI